MSKPKSYNETHVTIYCKDCGAPRVIRVQDAHQVVRCKDCQKVNRQEQRRMLRDKQKMK